MIPGHGWADTATGMKIFFMWLSKKSEKKAALREKRGEYVSSHLHLNVTYLLEADSRQPLSSKPDENKAVAWFEPDEVYTRSSEPWFVDRIYKKLNAKLAGFIRQEAQRKK